MQRACLWLLSGRSYRPRLSAENEVQHTYVHACAAKTISPCAPIDHTFTACMHMCLEPAPRHARTHSTQATAARLVKCIPVPVRGIFSGIDDETEVVKNKKSRRCRSPCKALPPTIEGRTPFPPTSMRVSSPGEQYSPRRYPHVSLCIPRVFVLQSPAWSVTSVATHKKKPRFLPNIYSCYIDPSHATRSHHSGMATKSIPRPSDPDAGTPL